MKKFLIKQLTKLLTVHKYVRADLVKNENGTPLEVQACYYNLNLEPVYVLRTKENQLLEEKEKFLKNVNDIELENWNV